MAMSFVPRNHPQLVARKGADDSVDDRRTPSVIFDPLHAEHGFTVDAAASSGNARLPRFFDRQSDGLVQSWAGEIVWCNPPYSDLAAWVAKAIRETANGGARKVVMLLPSNRSEQAWWQDLIEPIRDRGLGVTTRNLRGRPRFQKPSGTNIKRPGRAGSGAPFGCVVVVFEPCPRCTARAT